MEYFLHHVCNASLDFLASWLFSVLASWFVWFLGFMFSWFHPPKAWSRTAEAPPGTLVSFVLNAKRSGEQLGVGVRGAEHERAADRGREARGDHEPKCQAHVAVRDPHSDVALLRLALRRSVRRRLRANLKP